MLGCSLNHAGENATFFADEHTTGRVVCTFFFCSAFGALSVQRILWEIAVGDPREICGESMASSGEIQPPVHADVDMPEAGGAGHAVDGYKVSWTLLKVDVKVS